MTPEQRLKHEPRAHCGGNIIAATVNSTVGQVPVASAITLPSGRSSAAIPFE
jgi:hypothetical protein